MHNAVGSFLTRGSSEIAQALRAKEEAERAKDEAEKNLAEVLDAKTSVEREFAKYRATADERAHRLVRKITGLTAERDAAMQELHQARLGQGPAFTAFFERIVCSALFPDVATNLANCLSLLAIDAALDDVAKDFPTLEKGKYADPSPPGDDEVLRTLASVASGWIKASPVLKSVMTSPTLLSEEEIRQLCPEDRDADLERFLAEAGRAVVQPEGGSVPEERNEDEERTDAPNSDAPTQSEPPPNADAPTQSEPRPEVNPAGDTEATGHPSSEAVEHNVA